MADTIKILHIIKSLGRGGAEMLLPETLKLHDQRKFDFHYIYFLPWKNQMVEYIEKNGGKVSCFKASNNIRILLQTRAIIRYIHKYDIKLVHCHLPWAGFLGRIVHLLIKIPVIYTEHNKQERYHSITFQLNKLTFNWQQKVIAVSKDVERSIEENIHPKIPVQTILNGVNTESFRRTLSTGMSIREEYNIPENAFVIGTIAVFRFQKRLVEWLEVMATLCRSDDSIYGIVVGDGPLKDEIRKKRDELGLASKIIMPGLEKEVRPWLTAMDVYMMTSVFEGLPIALLEAMSMQCAIASTDAGGIKELVRNEVDGLLVPVDKWKELVVPVNRLKDKSNRELFSQRARARVVESFSMRRMVDELEAVYIQLVQTKMTNKSK